MLVGPRLRRRRRRRKLRLWDFMVHQVPALGGQVRYLLDDEFLDTRAAGAVDATVATPGPGTRVVADTGSDLSVSGGNLVIAGGTGGYTDPAFYLDGITRAAGRVVLWSWSAPSGFGYSGIDSNQSPDIVSPRYWIYANNIGIRSGATAIVTHATGGVAYRLALVVRDTGKYFFASLAGGVWKMLWIDATGTEDPFHPAVTSFNLVANLDFLRVPAALWLPTPLAYDAFTRANGAIGTSEASGPDSQTVQARTWTGATWTVASNEAVNTPTVGADVIVNGGFDADTDWTKQGNWAIGGGVATGAATTANLIAAVAPLAAYTWYEVLWDQTSTGGGPVPYLGGNGLLPVATGTGAKRKTGRSTTTGFIMRGEGFTGTLDNVVCKALTLSTLFASLETSTANIVAQVECDVVTAGTQVGMVVNLDDATTPANFVIAYHDGTNAKLDKCVAGTYTSVISAAATYAAGATLVVVKDGTSYSLFYNNAKVGSTSTVSDAGIVDNTLHGLFSTYSGNQLDNFLVMPRGSGGEYDGALNRYSGARP